MNSSSSNLTDSSLLQRFAANQDERAFRELVEKYTGLVYGVAIRRTGDSQRADEISFSSCPSTTIVPNAPSVVITIIHLIQREFWLSDTTVRSHKTSLA